MWKLLVPSSRREMNLSRVLLVSAFSKTVRIPAEEQSRIPIRGQKGLANGGRPRFASFREH
jgi:hypothetical protein